MNDSTAAARALVRALPGLGVRHVVLCPGSRSAPLAYALHAAELAGRLRLHVRHDERSAAFTALGVGRDGGVAAVVTTSGTAAANLHPAVLEAHHAGVPLLVLTADRPTRLRGTWANQTSDLQASMFGSTVRLALDLDAADLAAADRGAWPGALSRALDAARGSGGGRPGPVHLNLAFDDPLVPDDALFPDDREAPAPPSVPAWGDTPARPATQGHWGMDGGPRTVVVAGDGAGGGAATLAQAAGWPLLAEPTSGARHGVALPAPRLLAAHPALGGRTQRVVVLGRPTLSRPVAALLTREDVEVVQVVAHPDDPGPDRPIRRVVGVPEPPTGRDDAWLGAWQAAGDATRVAVDRVLDDGILSGPLLAREVWAATAPGHRLVVAASNPVRDLDLAGHPWKEQLRRRVLANRGLSGIDGTMSTAVGVAVSGPTRVLLGDLAFLHDLGALAVPASERAGLDLQMVVLNDDGGGIFALLEHGEPARAASFERVFGTPHGADLAALAAGFGVPHQRVDDLDHLRSLLAPAPSGLSVVEVRCDRDALRALHARIRAAVDTCLADRVGQI